MHKSSTDGIPKLCEVSMPECICILSDTDKPSDILYLSVAFECMNICIYLYVGFRYVCMYLCHYVHGVCICFYVCMYVLIYKFMYICMYIYICWYIC